MWAALGLVLVRTLDSMRRPLGAIRRRPARTLSLALVLAGVGAGLLGALTATALAGLAYSTASAHALQRQLPPGSCRARGTGIYSRPDPRCTPGALNPAVGQATIGSTICRSGWSSTVRPPASITEPEKFASMDAYGDGGRASAYEYDHLVPLELGGAVNDPRNLWPEPGYPVTTQSSFSRNPKDKLERALNRLVCSGVMGLSQAQRLIAANWVSAYRRYG
jgi:hypothetical protein